MRTIVVSGALANKVHNGGEAWVRLNWLLGFRDLGFDVWFIEQIASDRAQDVARAYFEKVISDFDFAGRAALVTDDGDVRCGPTIAELCDVADSAELLVNISGHLQVEPLFSSCRRKAYVDIDPGFTQIWHASGNPGARLAGHDVYFTIGENIGTPECPIPTSGICWHKVRPPIALKYWPAVATKDFEKFTTVANWRGPFGPIEFEGMKYGLKVHEFRKFIDLPRHVSMPFELALSIHPDETHDLSALREKGWQLADPSQVVASPHGFRDYLQHSSAEFSAAQGVYVESRSGWFSDRTAAYLACGKPVLVQQTGTLLPSGEGYIPFSTVDEAVAGAHAIVNDYPHQCAAARALAEAYFDSAKVLPAFLESAL